MSLKPLYLFPHIPKTGGAALVQNVERFLPRGKCLRLNYTHKQYYHDPRTGKLHFYETEEDFKNLIQSLSVAEKSELEFLSGHDLSFGLHEEFLQEARYFTFTREPIARTISLYNYQRYQHDFLKRMKNMDESHRRLALFSQKWFLKEGKVPSFEEWLEESYNDSYHFYWTQVRFLQEYGYLDKEIKEGSWDRMFEKFFFVGLVQTINEDELYLYHKMGTGRFWANRNASHPYISYSKLDKRIQEKIREKNPHDFELYQRAKIVNAAFKKQHEDFSKIVRKMKLVKQRAYIVEKALLPMDAFLRSLLRPVRNTMRNYFSEQFRG